MRPLTAVLILSAIIIMAIFLAPAFQLAGYDTRYLYASTAYGYSMYPLIKSGDLLIIAKKGSPYYNPEIGDILVYRYKNFYVAHRLIHINGDIYFLKGDNNDYVERVKEENVVGEVIEVIPRENLIAGVVVKNLIF